MTGVGDWHVNADEPSILDYNTEFKTPAQVASLYAPDEFRISDHDPVVVGLDLTNAAPVVGTVTGPTSAVSVGAPASVSATFTDADPLDTHTASIAWGDGQSSAGTVTGGTVSGSHVYSAAGVYTVTVTVTDQWGNTGTGTTTVVVYDRAAGFLTGGGWFVSPAGRRGPTRRDAARAASAVRQLREQAPAVPTGSSPTPRGTTFASPRRLRLARRQRLDGDLLGPATVNGASYRAVVTVTDRARTTPRRRDAARTVVYDSGTQAVKGQVVIH